MKRTFTNFSIEADFEIPVMYDNFFKHSITVRNSEDIVIGTIRKEELTLNLANDFATGDENVVKGALLCIILNREMYIKELRKTL